MTKNFLIEDDVEQVAIDWLKNLGYAHMAGADIRRDFKKVVLEDRLKNLLVKQYPNLQAEVIGEYLAPPY